MIPSDVERRTDVVRAMHEIMVNTNDENAYFSWIWVVPDGADDGDFRDIAEDYESYVEVCDLFIRLINRYGKGGI